MNVLLITLFVLGVLSVRTSGQNLDNNDCVKAHNQFRAKHGVPPLKGDPKLVEIARKRAKTNADADNMSHNGKPNGVGENLAWRSGGVSSCSEPVSSWYSEIKKYNFKDPNPKFSTATGHFTQVVWKSTTSVGCASAKSRSNKIYTACNYQPAGNFAGKFKENVPPPSGGLTRTAVQSQSGSAFVHGEGSQGGTK